MKTFLLLLLASIVIVLVVGIDQFLVLRKAHSTFENYYAFRGCKQLLQRTSTYGICKTASGKTVKIVLFHKKWYLDGDLPMCYENLCW